MVGKPYSKCQGFRLKGFRPKVGVRSSKTFSLNPFSLLTCLGPISGESLGEAMGQSDHAG
jgi:hypothetical protein